MWTIYISKKLVFGGAAPASAIVAVPAHFDTGKKHSNHGRRCAVLLTSWLAILAHMVGEVLWYHRVPRTAPGRLEHHTGDAAQSALAHFGSLATFGPSPPAARKLQKSPILRS